jgi:hypothetical protein
MNKVPVFEWIVVACLALLVAIATVFAVVDRQASVWQAQDRRMVGWSTK